MTDDPNIEKQARIYQRIAPLLNSASSDTDPQGMYTGVPANPYEQPTQDADDL